MYLKNAKENITGTKRYAGTRSGSTLISSLIAVAIILIALIGTSNFRYHTSMDSRRATALTEASRIALLLCESWRGLQGDLDYDPITNLSSDFTISSDEGPSSPDGFTSLGSYLIQLGSNNDDRDEYHISYYTTLSWQDIQPGLRALNVNVAWAQRDTNTGYDIADKSFSLTIYTLTVE
ncbi:MAG: hypothetical protein JW787_15945 [Sedimentisphaerales bacterium]|nr:hypothetical protein [Sedimentisphaerales bacterium]